MLRLLKATFFGFQSAKHWLSALRYSGQGENEKALQELSRMKIVRKDNFEYFTLKAALLAAEQKAEQSEQAIAEARARLKRCGDLSSHDERYVEAFWEWITVGNLQTAAPDKKREDLFNLDAELLQVELDNVTARLKEIFPLTVHPEWVEPKAA